MNANQHDSLWNIEGRIADIGRMTRLPESEWTKRPAPRARKTRRTGAKAFATLVVASITAILVAAPWVE